MYIYINIIRGYPEPTITWQREDKQPIVLRDSGGGSMRGKTSMVNYFPEELRAILLHSIVEQKL